jgi:hypothetical protein
LHSNTLNSIITVLNARQLYATIVIVPDVGPVWPKHVVLARQLYATIVIVPDDGPVWPKHVVLV